MKRLGRRTAELFRCLLSALLACMALSVGGVRADTDHPHDDSADSGIWKAVVPPTPMHGNFENRDPIGLKAGADIPTDCSINWRSPDTGELYCFSTGTSLLLFLEWPNANARMAEAAWAARLQQRQADAAARSGQR